MLPTLFTPFSSLHTPFRHNLCFAPYLFPFDPSVQDEAIPVEDDEICVCARSEGSFLILDADTPAGHPLAITSPIGFEDSYLAGLYVAHLMASLSEQPVNLAKFRTHVSKVTTLPSLVSEWGIGERK